MSPINTLASVAVQGDPMYHLLKFLTELLQKAADTLTEEELKQTNIRKALSNSACMFRIYDIFDDKDARERFLDKIPAWYKILFMILPFLLSIVAAGGLILGSYHNPIFWGYSMKLLAGIYILTSAGLVFKPRFKKKVIDSDAPALYEGSGLAPMLVTAAFMMLFIPYWPDPTTYGLINFVGACYLVRSDIMRNFQTFSGSSDIKAIEKFFNPVVDEEVADESEDTV